MEKVCDTENEEITLWNKMISIIDIGNVVFLLERIFLATKKESHRSHTP